MRLTAPSNLAVAQFMKLLIISCWMTRQVSLFSLKIFKFNVCGLA